MIIKFKRYSFRVKAQQEKASRPGSRTLCPRLYSSEYLVLVFPGEYMNHSHPIFKMPRRCPSTGVGVSPTKQHTSIMTRNHLYASRSQVRTEMYRLQGTYQGWLSSSNESMVTRNKSWPGMEGRSCFFNMFESTLSPLFTKQMTGLKVDAEMLTIT